MTVGHIANIATYKNHENTACNKARSTIFRQIKWHSDIIQIGSMYCVFIATNFHTVRAIIREIRECEES